MHDGRFGNTICYISRNSETPAHQLDKATPGPASVPPEGKHTLNRDFFLREINNYTISRFMCMDCRCFNCDKMIRYGSENLSVDAEHEFRRGFVVCAHLFFTSDLS